MPLKLSVSNLGTLAIPNFCKRCLWFLIHLRFYTPFDKGFPSIFNDIDHHTKRIVTAYIDQHAEGPSWLGRFANTASYLEPKKMKYTDPHSDIILVGEPDALLADLEGYVSVIDYKTARYTKGQDHLLGKYRVQLNAYRYLLSKTEDWAASGLALVYCEPQNAVTAADARNHTTKSGFTLAFKPRIVEIEIEPDDFIPGLLAQFRAIADLSTPPDGREGCYSCKDLDILLQLADPTKAAKERNPAAVSDWRRAMRLSCRARDQFDAPTVWTEWNSDFPGAEPDPV